MPVKRPESHIRGGNISVSPLLNVSKGGLMSLNKFMVGMRGDRLIVPMLGSLSIDDALNLAAWLVVIAAVDTEKDFLPLLKEIQES